MGWIARERDFYPVSRPRLKVRAGRLPSPPNGASLSSATVGEVAKTAFISASTPCACSSSCSS
eukprot:1225576-Pleurochrysis_carterae.AAC.1